MLEVYNLRFDFCRGHRDFRFWNSVETVRDYGDLQSLIKCILPYKMAMSLWEPRGGLCMAPIWWNCLEEIKRCGLLGRGVSLEVDFEVSKAHSTPSYLSALCLWIKI